MSDSRFLRRRSVVRRLAAAVAVAGGGVAWRAVGESAFSAGMGEAYDPWKTWREPDRLAHEIAFAKYEPDEAVLRAMKEGDSRLDLIRAAELAPSTLNSQPWLFRLAPDWIDVLQDHTRRLPVLDPHGTELLVAIGAALQNLELAAAASGQRVEVTIPSATSGSVARIRLLPMKAASSPVLYDAIPSCHDYFGPYDPAHDTSGDLEPELASLAEGNRTHILALPAERRRDAAATSVEAVRQVAADRNSLDEIHRWFRQSREAIYLTRDGISVDMFGLPLLQKIAVKIGPGMDAERLVTFLVSHAERTFGQGDTYGLIGMNGAGTADDYVDAGRLWQKLRLWARSKGLSVHSLNQAVTGALNRTVGSRGGRERLVLEEFLRDFATMPVICWRLGRPQLPVIPGPRRSIHQMISASPAA